MRAARVRGKASKSPTQNHWLTFLILAYSAPKPSSHFTQHERVFFQFLPVSISHFNACLYFRVTNYCIVRFHRITATAMPWPQNIV